MHAHPSSCRANPSIDMLTSVPCAQLESPSHERLFRPELFLAGSLACALLQKRGESAGRTGTAGDSLPRRSGTREEDATARTIWSGQRNILSHRQASWDVLASLHVR